MINTGLCEICEKGFAEAESQVAGKERSNGAAQTKTKNTQDVSQAGGGISLQHVGPAQRRH